MYEACCQKSTGRLIMELLYAVVFFLAIFGADGQGSSPLPVAAFSQGQNTHLHLTQGEILNYNKLITTVHSTIDSRGVFTATAKGLYAFHFYSLTMTNTELWLELLKNDKVVCSAYAHNPSKGGYADAGNSVFLYLNPRDTVYVKAHDAYNNALFGATEEIYTTFTGILFDSGYFENEGYDKSKPNGFSVGLDKNLTINDGSNVAYDVDFTKNSTLGGYNFTSHQYVAPYEGIYIFHLHALSLADMEVYLDLYKNKQYVLSAYAYTTNEWGDAGNTAIIHLLKGDHVAVKARPHFDVTLFGDPAQIYCTFSGALLSMTVPGSHLQTGGYSEVAFMVGLSHDVNITAFSKVQWHRLFTNVGNGFDMRTGTFTAKVDGVYVFHFHGLSETGQEMYLELYHNYEYVVSAYAYDANSYAAGSNAVTLRLLAGDVVYIGGQNVAGLSGGNGQIYCTFSGYLLAPISQSHLIIG